MASVKLICGLFFVAFLACVQAELETVQLEKDLQNSKWTEEPVDMDDSYEVTGRDGKEKPSCSCMDSSCGCCVKSKVFGMRFPACLNVTIITNETAHVEALEVTAHLNNEQIAEYNFTTVPYSKMCKPMRYLSFISICLFNNNTNIGENGIVSCSSVDLMIRKTSAARLKLTCVQFKDNKLTFFDNDTGKKAWFNIKVKSPLQHFVSYVQANNVTLQTTGGTLQTSDVPIETSDGAIETSDV